MSDLGAIFHVKKAGVQYDAHAYTTVEECPEPNLKINFKGTQAYVKLMNNGEGNVPCYVKPKSANMIYQVQKEAGIVPPTGSTIIKSSASFTVPPRVTVLYITGAFPPVYVGVTPNTTHEIMVDLQVTLKHIVYVTVICTSHHIEYATERNYIDYGGDFSYMESIEISWSPEINKHAINVKDY